MISPLTSTPLPTDLKAGSQPSSPEKIAKAAHQFEALLIGQMMKSMKDSQGGWFGAGEDESASSAMDYAQEMFAQSLSSKGGLGLANMVVSGLKQSEEKP
jgi:Rod binding domain-containing protein